MWIKKGSGAMLVVKESVRVALEMNMKNSLLTLKEQYKHDIYPGFKLQGRCHNESKTGVSVAYRNEPSVYICTWWINRTLCKLECHALYYTN